MVARPHPFARATLTALCVLAAAWPLLEAANDLRAVAFLSPFAALALAAAWRTWRLRVEAGADGVTVGNLWRTRHVPWNAVDRFVATDKGLRLVRRDGTTVALTAFTASPRELGFVARHRDAALRSLEAYRRRR